VSVPVTAPKAVESTGTENVVELITVAVRLAFRGVQFPVPPLIVTIGKELVLKPCPPLTVTTAAAAFDTDAIEIAGDVG
jgi:hypothetical protein